MFRHSGVAKVEVPCDGASRDVTEGNERERRNERYHGYPDI